MYAFSIADIAYSLVKLGMIYLGILITEGIVIMIYDKWKGKRHDTDK